MIEIGLKTLEWLTAVQKAPDGYFSPIGTNGFWPRNGVRACFDQQPIDAYATISACLTALRITKEKIWASETAIAFNWFLGANHLGAPVYDPVTGGCRDGLHQDRMNENQGAESTLAFLMSVAELERAGMIHVSRSESSNLRS